MREPENLARLDDKLLVPCAVFHSSLFHASTLGLVEALGWLGTTCRRLTWYARASVCQKRWRPGQVFVLLSFLRGYGQ